MLLSGIIFAGLLNAAVLAVVCGVASRSDRKAAWLSAVFALYSAVMTAIVVSHTYEGQVERIAVAVEQAAWAGGPLMLHYLRAATGRVVTLRRAWPHFIPAGLAALLAPFVILGRIEPPRVEALVAWQTLYLVASIWLFLRRPDPADRSLHGFWWPLALIFAFVAVLVGQLWRIVGARGADAVPLLGALGVLAGLLVALIVRQRTPAGQRYAKSALDRSRAETIHAAALGALQGDALYRRHDLSLGDLAAAIGVPAHHLSQSLSEVGGKSFAEIVGDCRVEDAKQRLTADANRAVAVEPLGMEAGFRSRSAFYTAFRERTGLTPAEYRRRAADDAGA